MKKVLSVFVVLCMTIPLFSAVFCYAVDNIGADDMVDISVDDDFTDDCVIVVLDNETSLKFKEYDSNSFSTIDCKQVRDLTYSIDASVEAAMENIAQHCLDNEPLMEYNGVELGKYNRILCIELTTPGKANVISAINKLQRMEGVLYASPNFKFETTISSNDPLVGETSPEGNTNYEYWQLTKIFSAWNINKGSEAVQVGVMDTGIDRLHEDLIENLNTQLGRNFLGDGSGAHVDSNGHGTAVAGIIGAQGNNNQGISGVCWDVELVSLKVSNDEGDSEFADIAAAVNYAYANDIDILNFSSSSKSEILDAFKGVMQEAIENYNGLFVCSAGNDYSDIDSSPIYPASFDLPNVITVGASDRNDAIWYESITKGSNYGWESVDIFAPGVEILTTAPDGLYGWATGTSYASPMVAGVAALLLSEKPDLLPEEIKYIIEASADPKQNLMGYSESGGRLNARKAVEYAEDHERIYVTSDNQYHTYMCDDCGFEEDMKHDLYVYSQGANSRILRCRICNHSFQCSHAIACDVYTYDIYHMIRCVWCEYVILELHGPYTYSVIIGNNNYHTIVCQDCNHSTVQAHTWILKGSSYFCPDCGMTTNIRPPIVAGSIEEENETASLPPVNDKEKYTE